MHLTPAGIMGFPKKEIWVTQNSNLVSIKIDFCEMAIAGPRTIIFDL
ncbi:14256_t:CDS:1, partial [Rhizophagus irregularis]